jgi:hypothetical protein
MAATRSSRTGSSSKAVICRRLCHRGGPPSQPLLRWQRPPARTAPHGWGDSNSGPPPEVVPGRGCTGRPTCGSLAPVVTAGARCSPLPAGCVCPPCTGGLRSRSVADASGAPVLRDQGPDRPAGHGKADHSLDQVSEARRVVSR